MNAYVQRLGTIAALAGVLCLGRPSPVAAHMPGQPHSMLEKNAGYVQADPALFEALVALGGGPARFHGITFRQAVMRTPERDRKLRDALGFDALNRFDRVLTTAVDDRLRYLRERHAAIVPIPTRLRDPQGFVDAFYAAGAVGGVFSVERAYDRLFGTDGHEAIMETLTRRFSPLDDQAFHRVMQRIVFAAKSR